MSDKTRMVKRYGPIVAAAVLIGGAIALFGQGSDDNDDDQASASDAAIDNDALTRSGPMTPTKADLLGEDDVDFGPHCDTDTGRLKLPTVVAPPCVEPFEGDNGGETSPGVTEDEILIVAYATDPALDPLAAGLVSGAGANIDPAKVEESLRNYVDLYNEMFETYGRKVRLERFIGSGSGSDQEAAKADAIKIAEMKPFAVIGGPFQATLPFATELAARGVICGPNCAIAEPESIVERYYPLIWEPGPTPQQAAALAAEMISKLAGPGKAEYAGDDATRAKDRRYALVHYDTAEGIQQEVFEELRDQLADAGIELATDIPFELDLERAQETARTIIARLEDEDITTVLYYGDPFTPGPLTKEAAAQDFNPEWILGPSALADTTFFARMMDGEQWSHGFGMSLPPGRAAADTNVSVRIYEWAFGEAPPANTVTVAEPPLRVLFTGISLAGPELTPETFRDGLFRAPPAGGGPTAPAVSWGDHGIWPDPDYGLVDDMTIVWWDPEATGEDELGAAGSGMYRYALGGQRYKLGDLPDSVEEAGLFDVDRSVTVYEELPTEDTPSDYEPPDLSD